MNLSSTQPSLLLVEANKCFRQYLKRILDSSVLNIIEAIDGNDASIKYECTLPELVIVDMHIDNVDGIGLIQKIRSRDLNTKIIALSDEEQLLKKARQHGANEAMLKTFEPAHLVSLLETYVQNHVAVTESA